MTQQQGLGVTGDTAWATEALTVSSTPRQCGHAASHLLLFQQDQAHDSDVDGVPDVGVKVDAGHLPKRGGQAVTPDLGYGQPLPTPDPHPRSHTGELRSACRLPTRLPNLCKGLPTLPGREGHPQSRMVGTQEIFVE